MVISSRTRKAFPLEIVALVSNDWMQSGVDFQKLQNCTNLKFSLFHSFFQKKDFWLLLHI